MAKGKGTNSQSFGSVLGVFMATAAVVVLGIVVLAGLSAQQVELACNDVSAAEAQGLLNQAFPNFNGALRLKNPELVEQTETTVRCRVDSNIHQTFYYNLELQDDGSILILANPIADAIEEAAQEFQDELEKVEQEWQAESDRLDQEWQAEMQELQREMDAEMANW